MRLEDLGPPVKSSGDWDVWHHGCGPSPYPDLLYNRRSGWLVCKSCGLRRKLGRVGHHSPRKVYDSNPTGINFDPIEEGSPYERYLSHRLGGGRVFGDWAVHPDHLDRVCALVIERGEVAFWHARAIPPGLFLGRALPLSSSVRKWLSPNSPKDSVYNFDRIERGKPVFVCEGVFDALWFWPYGVAVMGTHSNEAQRIKLLERGVSAVYICPDADVSTNAVAGEAAAWYRLSRAVKVMSIRPKQGFSDWGEMLQVAGPQGLRKASK